jgi:hypothetical protein
MFKDARKIIILLSLTHSTVKTTGFQTSAWAIQLGHVGMQLNCGCLSPLQNDNGVPQIDANATPF